MHRRVVMHMPMPMNMPMHVRELPGSAGGSGGVDGDGGDAGGDGNDGGSDTAGSNRFFSVVYSITCGLANAGSGVPT